MRDHPIENIAAAPLPRAGRFAIAAGMVLTALCIGYALFLDEGNYSRGALVWLSLGAIFCFLTVTLPENQAAEALCRRRLTMLLVGGIIIEAARFLQKWGHDDSSITLGICVIVILGLLQATHLRRLRTPLFLIMIGTFCLVWSIGFRIYAARPGIDVYVFQQRSANELLHGRDPYATRFPNVYEPDTPFYGPGVVDANNWLTYGFPYPPLSLLMVMPGYILGGDCRYAHVLAMSLAAILMAMARPGRWGALAATLFLLTPQTPFVLDLAWTEPLLAFNFSLAMFCACRWRKALPYALGLFFATKQYTVLALPALFLLIDGPNPWKQLWDIVFRAGMVVAVITVPFFLWNPHEFIRAVVLWQLVQPFRLDALSYLVFVYHHNGHHRLPVWTPLLAVIPAMGIACWRLRRSPAGFAAAVTFINLAFFAFNKQAFCNYYYFVVATACWAIAATGAGEPESAPVPAEVTAARLAEAHVPS
ncbi:MAG: hypothetical protein M3O30_12025 [Planctomycetota bacterium]|nr:hypothetical protein [Planctomycetota bacterium]